MTTTELTSSIQSTIEFHEGKIERCDDQIREKSAYLGKHLASGMPDAETVVCIGRAISGLERDRTISVEVRVALVDVLRRIDS